jgi:hypothetical protein
MQTSSGSMYTELNTATTEHMSCNPTPSLPTGFCDGRDIYREAGELYGTAAVVSKNEAQPVQVRPICHVLNSWTAGVFSGRDCPLMSACLSVGCHICLSICLLVCKGISPFDLSGIKSACLFVCVA